MHRRQFLITTGTAAVGILAGPRPSLAQLAIPQTVDKQLFDWLSEQGGLLDWVNDSQLDPANHRARPDLGGLTLMEHSQAQIALIMLLRQRGAITRASLSDHMVIVAEDLRNSYNRAPEAEWAKLNGTLNRTIMRNFMNSVLAIAERPIISPVIPPVPPRAIGQSSGTQYALPTSDSSNNWANNFNDGFPFDDTTAWDEIDEGHGSGRGSGSGPDDGTSGWTSGDSPSNLSLITNLSSVTDPASSTNHIYRGRSLKYSNGSGAQIDITMRLLENGTQRATQTFTNIGGAWTTRAVTLTAGEADAITNYGLLEIDTQANKVGGGAPRSARESAQEFECPDAGAAPNNKFLLQPF